MMGGMRGTEHGVPRRQGRDHWPQDASHVFSTIYQRCRGEKGQLYDGEGDRVRDVG
jgi:hypothetical protein